MSNNKKFLIRDWINRNNNLTQLIVITVLIFIVMSLLNPGKFLRYYNFESITFSFPELGLLAVAVMISMLTGGIDLSVIAVANFSVIVAGKYFQFAISQDLSNTPFFIILFGLLFSLSIGVLCGALNGVLITRARITPILTTMGTAQLFTGLSLVITGGPAIVGFPDLWAKLGNSKLLGLATPFWLFLLISIFVGYILTKTTLGMKLLLIGTNPKAAIFSGIKKNKVIFQSYLITGFLAAVTGVIMSGRANAAKSDYGNSYVLQAVLVAVLAGTNPAGGYGTVLGVFIAVVGLTFLSSGFQIMRVSNFLIDFIWGAFLLTVMVVNYYANKRRTKYKSSEN